MLLNVIAIKFMFARTIAYFSNVIITSRPPPPSINNKLNTKPKHTRTTTTTKTNNPLTTPYSEPPKAHNPATTTWNTWKQKQNMKTETKQQQKHNKNGVFCEQEYLNMEYSGNPTATPNGSQDFNGNTSTFLHFSNANRRACTHLFGTKLVELWCSKQQRGDFIGSSKYHNEFRDILSPFPCLRMPAEHRGLRVGLEGP